VDSPVADGKEGGGPTKKTQAVHKERQRSLLQDSHQEGGKIIMIMNFFFKFKSVY
jgi:hypothetical protein